MNERELEELYRELNSEEPQRRLAAARQLAEQGEAGAAVLVRALTEYPWLDEWSDQLKTIGQADMTHNGAIVLPPFFHINFGSTSFLPSVVDTPPVHVLQALIYMGKWALPEVIPLLLNERVELRLAALLILVCNKFHRKKILPDPAPLVNSLRQLLDDAEPGVFILACGQLTAFQEHAYPVIPDLVERYHQALDTPKRMVIVLTLIALHCSTQITEEIVCDFVRRSDEQTRREIFHECYFSHFRTNAEPLVPLMMDYIQARMGSQEYWDNYDAKFVAQSLGLYGAAGRQAIMELAQSPDSQAQALALEALDCFPEDEDGRQFAGFLLTQLEPLYVAGDSGFYSDAERILRKIAKSHGLFPEDEARWQTLKQIQAEKRASPEYMEALIRDLQSEDSEVVGLAVRKARELQEHVEEVAPLLLQAMFKFKGEAYSCKDALKQQASRITGMAPDLINALMQNKGKHADYYAEVLEAMGSLIAHETPRLMKLLGRDAATRSAGLKIIKAIGPAALEHQSDLIMVLAERLQDPEPQVGVEAAAALGVMGRAARLAAPQLMAAAQVNSIKLVGAAREALARIYYDAPGSSTR